MLKLKPEIWTRNGKQQFVLLPYEQYQALRERLEDAEDLRLLRQSKKRQRGAPTITLAEMKKRLGMTRRSASKSR